MSGGETAAGRVFISYARADAPEVDELQARLEAAGVRVWRDTSELLPGQDWPGEIRRAISKESVVFLACFSSESVSRATSYQYAELVQAVEQLMLRRPDVRWLIPVRFDECEIPDFEIGGGRRLSSIQRVDLFGDQRGEQAERLVEAVRQILGDAANAARRSQLPGRGRARALDLARFRALSAHAAAEELARTADWDAVGLLAEAPPDRSAEVLGVLVQAEELRVTALLALMNRVSAQDLADRMAAVDESLGWLRQLPAAAKAMAECALKVRSDLGGASGPVARARASQRGTPGFWRRYERGDVHWSDRGGAQASAGPIADLYRDLGGSSGRLGFPVSAAVEAVAPSSRTAGSWQRFESWPDYGDETCRRLGLRCGGTVYWSEHGAHATWGPIGEFYEQQHGLDGWLGFPVSGETEITGTDRHGGEVTSGLCQRFEGGTVCYSEKTNAIALRGPVASHYEHKHRGAKIWLGFPVSVELPAAPSPYKTTGYLQRFEGRRDYGNDIVKCWSDSERPGGATIYTSEAHGTHSVGWRFGELYERLRGTSSWLGFPTSDEITQRTASGEYRCQEFEGGTIIFSAAHGSVAVPKATIEYLDQRAGLRDQIGLPLKRPHKSAGDEPVQHFENGVITLRDGTTEAWVAAASSRGPDPQDINFLELDCDAQTIVPGQTVTLAYKIRSQLDRPVLVALGASMIAANGDEYFDEATDRHVNLIPGEAAYQRRLQVPVHTPEGSYRLAGGIWYPSIGGQRLARTDCPFTLTVHSS